jgi:ubiquinone/menaquinone biosynthesis C-methylase UbiE
MKISIEHYKYSNYDDKNRWFSYWHQINEVLALNPENILEIGVGSKTVSVYLKNQNKKVVTMDIDKNLKPDIVGNVLKIPFDDNYFDVVLCAEVLEHLPFAEFQRSLSEIKRVTKKYLVLSLPHWGKVLYFVIKLPLFKKRVFFLRLSIFEKKDKLNPKHFWEIGRKSYPEKKIKEIIKNSGFKIVKDFFDYNNSYHHFFILKK